MKKKQNPSGDRQSDEQSSGQGVEVAIHVRRCHVCGHVNESHNCAVNKCSDCGKYLPPFYYFNESELDGLADNGFYLSQCATTHQQDPTYRPIWGLSTYWDDTCLNSTSN